jgi:hypothetical protein
MPFRAYAVRFRFSSLAICADFLVDERADSGAGRSSGR